MASLADLIGALDAVPIPDRYGPAPTIYARRPWTGESEADVRYGEGSVGVEPGFVYLLEVDLAKEAIEVWSEWRERRMPTLSDAVGAVIWYAEHDAYEPLDADTK